MITTTIRTFIIYCVVGLSVRLMGKRQLGELQPGELIITILVSEIVATPITDNSVPILNGILPLLLLVSFEILSSVLARKSVKFRYITDGKPLTVIKNGVLQQNAIKILRFTIDDVLSALRQKDVFNIEDVEYAVAETNGTLSVLLKQPKRNMTNESFQGKEYDNGAPLSVIIDGKIIDRNIEESVVTVNDVKRKLQRENVGLDEVLLMTVDKKKNYYVIIKKEF